MVLGLLSGLMCYSPPDTRAQDNAVPEAKRVAPPEKIVESLWTAAMRGELLTPEGWSRSSRHFANENEVPRRGIVRVVSNYFGVNSSSVTDGTAEVEMEFTDLGQIGADLRYTSPKPTRALKTSLVYRLVSRPVHLVHYGPDGKTITEDQEIREATTWVIEGGPGLWCLNADATCAWTTLNTAIRYVLEKREKASDPVCES